MSQKFFIIIGVAFFAVFGVGIATVAYVTTMNSATPAVPVAVANAESTPAVTAPQPVVEAPALKLAASQPSVLPVPQNPESTSVTVQNSDIDQLANAVKLGGSNTGDVGKDIWARETPIAERLLKGMCDCDQRNWLSHFVKAGKEAMSGSENYYQSVQSLSKLRRSNQDLAAQPPPP